MILTVLNFDLVITTNEFVLVEFYSPLDPQSALLAPEYARAAGHLTLMISPTSPSMRIKFKKIYIKIKASFTKLIDFYT